MSFSYFTNGSLVLESKSCSSLAEKNIYSSAKWHSLSIEDNCKVKHKSMAVDMDKDPEQLLCCNVQQFDGALVHVQLHI